MSWKKALIVIIAVIILLLSLAFLWRKSLDYDDCVKFGGKTTTYIAPSSCTIWGMSFSDGDY